jgi:SulP family sulfate permease
MGYSIVTGYSGSVVGDVPVGLPPLTVDLPWSRLPLLILPGTVIALVGFAEAASISRMFASEDREHWNADREFISQGVANLTAGLTGGFPVGGSFGRSSLNRLVGAQSRWSGLVTGVTVLLFLPFADVLAPLPTAVLAGIVIAAVYSLFRPRGLIKLWGISRPQAMVGWTTFVLTLTLAPHVEEAVLLGMLLAGAIHLWRELRPDVTSRRDGDTLHIEPQGVLWFGSAPALDDEILAHLGREPDVDRVVIKCAGLGRIDLTGAYVLAELLEHLTRAGVEVELTDVPEHAARVLSAAGAHDEEGGETVSAPATADGDARGGT